MLDNKEMSRNPFGETAPTAPAQITPKSIWQEILKAGFFFSMGYFVNELTAGKRRRSQGGNNGSF